MAGIQYCVQYLNESGWMAEHDNEIYNKSKQDFIKKLKEYGIIYDNGLIYGVETKVILLSEERFKELFE